MRKLLSLSILFGCFNAFGCSDLLKSYDLECKTQDRYQKLENDFKTYSITITNLKEFIIPKAIGKAPYFSSKNELLNHTNTALAQDQNWQYWNKSQKFIKNMNPVYLELSDIIKLHKTFNPDSIRLRSDNGETNPKINLDCSDKVLNENLLNVLSDYDLQSVEGYPILKLANVTLCPDKKYNSAELFYYKGASVKIELTRWLTDLNDMFDRYENGNAPAELSPYNYLADMRRWFLALKPFDTANEQVVNAMIDYSTNRLGLAPLSFANSANPIYFSSLENRDDTLKNLQATLSFFEGCLFETKTNLISEACKSL